MSQLPPIELRYLRYFVAVAEELNFRKAAARLHVTASALSMQIKKLEDLLEVQLCVRSTSIKMHLTPAGSMLLKEARDLLLYTEKLVDTIRDTASTERGGLRIGMSEFFGQSFIMDAIKTYQSLYPAENVEWVELDAQHEMSEALESGHVQIGIDYDFHLQHMKHVERLLIMDSPVNVVMGAEHPLASMKQVPLSLLASQKMLCLRNSWFDFQDLPVLLQDKHLQLQNIKRVHGFDSFMLAKMGNITLLSEKQATALCSQIVHRPISGLGADVRVRLYAVWKSHNVTPRMLNFIELLKERQDIAKDSPAACAIQSPIQHQPAFQHQPVIQRQPAIQPSVQRPIQRQPALPRQPVTHRMKSNYIPAQNGRGTFKNGVSVGEKERVFA